MDRLETKCWPGEKRGAPPAVEPRGGYTLMELLVAMSILVMMGGGLITLLNQGITIWRTSENRGRAYERGRAILDGVAEDLRSAITRARGRDETAWLRFIADEGPGGRQRLRFVRTIPGETADAILREGGRLLSTRTPAVYDGNRDIADAAAGLLAAPAGAMEVLYMLDPRPGTRLLWRGVRSPAGGPGSLLVDRNVEERREPSVLERRGRRTSRPPAGTLGKTGTTGTRASARTTGTRGTTAAMATASRTAPKGKAASEAGGSAAAGGVGAPGAPATAGVPSAGTGVTATGGPAAAGSQASLADDTFHLSDVAAPVASEVLFLGFRFWTPGTNTWRDVPPLESPRPGEPSGPTPYWDSTLALLDLPGDSREFRWRRVPGSLDDPTDDIFPERVEVTAVVSGDYRRVEVRLAEPLAERGDTIALSGLVNLPEDPLDRLVLIDDEWIAVGEISGFSMKVAPGGRGRRFTAPARHEPGALVEVGVTFRRVVEIPGFRSPFREEAATSAVQPRGRLR